MGGAEIQGVGLLNAEQPHPLNLQLAQAMATTVNSLLELHQLEGLADKKVSDEHLNQISHSCNWQWKLLHPHLEFPAEIEGVVEQEIEDMVPNDEEGWRFALLSKWKDTKGSEATYRMLIRALLEIGCREDAEALLELIRPIPVVSQELMSSGKWWCDGDPANQHNNYVSFSYAIGDWGGGGGTL